MDADQARSTVMPTLRYRDARAAIEWLTRVLGFVVHASYPGPDNSIGHAELTLGGGMIMLGSEKDDAYGKGFKSPGEVGNVETRSTYIVVKDAEAVWHRAQAAGAQVVRPLQATDYGSHEFTIKDPEGHSWSVGTYDPWATPAM
ncbi:MAG TPA: VOC family protein [Candidatus Saccharimonadales bacterium]|nr:VOC family protein [Candidatus Saccharimonadales bacterium]